MAQQLRMLTVLLVENTVSISSTYTEVLITGDSIAASSLLELLNPCDTLAQAYIHTHKIKKKKTRWDIIGKHRVLTSDFRECGHTHAQALARDMHAQKEKENDNQI